MQRYGGRCTTGRRGAALFDEAVGPFAIPRGTGPPGRGNIGVRFGDTIDGALRGIGGSFGRIGGLGGRVSGRLGGSRSRLGFAGGCRGGDPLVVCGFDGTGRSSQSCAGGIGGGGELHHALGGSGRTGDAEGPVGSNREVRADLHFACHRSGGDGDGSGRSGSPAQVHSLSPRAVGLLEAQRRPLPFMLRRQAVSSIRTGRAGGTGSSTGSCISLGARLSLRPLRSLGARGPRIALGARFALFPLLSGGACGTGGAVSSCRALDALCAAFALGASGTDPDPKGRRILLRRSPGGGVFDAFPDLPVERHTVKYRIALRAAVFAPEHRAHAPDLKRRHRSPPVRRRHRWKKRPQAVPPPCSSWQGRRRHPPRTG